MKTLKILILMTFAWMGMVHAQVSQRSKSVVTKGEVTSWEQGRRELLALEAVYRRKDLSEDAKFKYMPRTNEVLSYVQDFNLNRDEKDDMIKVAVAVIAAVIDIDNSPLDTLYFDYKANKQAYLREIGKIGSKRIRSEILENFRDLESAEIENESESGPKR